MKLRLNHILILMMLAVMASCGKGEIENTGGSGKTGGTTTETPGTPTGNKPKAWEIKHVEINATDFQKWVYFSFEKGKVVEVEHPENDLSWDLAFRRTFTRTNSGTSGRGQGGAAETPFKDLNKVEARFLNTNPYTVDTKELIPVEFSANGGNGRDQMVSVNAKLRGVYLADITQMPPLIAYSNIVYFVKTTTGKYAAIFVNSYEKEISKTAPLKRGYIDLDYIYPVTPTAN